MTTVATTMKFWGKIGYNSAYMRDIRDIFVSSRDLPGRAIERRQTNSTTTSPRCHGNEIWFKIGYNSACTRDISETFASNRGFSGSGYRMMSIKFYNDRPWLPWQRNLRQNRL